MIDSADLLQPIGKIPHLLHLAAVRLEGASGVETPYPGSCCDAQRSAPIHVAVAERHKADMRIASLFRHQSLKMQSVSLPFAWLLQSARRALSRQNLQNVVSIHVYSIVHTPVSCEVITAHDRYLQPPG